MLITVSQSDIALINITFEKLESESFDIFLQTSFNI